MSPMNLWHSPTLMEDVFLYKTGEIVGLNYTQVQTIGSLVASAADVGVHPSVFPEIDSKPVDGKTVMVITIGRGIATPYTNNRGEVYVKQGPDKRRVTDANEMLRLFAQSGNYQPDRQPVRGSSIKDLDRYALDEFFEKTFGNTTDNLSVPIEKALRNINILDDNGEATLGGLMFFGKKPQRQCPAFNIKAVWFYGTSIGETEYRSSVDIDGPVSRMFDEGMRFIASCLHHVQAGQNFNSIGKLEIPEVALSEILQNALVHRSWLKPAPIRILIFADRVEIISPGALHPTLTVEDIKMGNAFQRNQLMATLCAKTMDYRGLGSGIIRALKADANIEFHNEASGDQFRVILWRVTNKSNLEIEDSEEIGKDTTDKIGVAAKVSLKSDLKSGPKSNLKIIEAIQINPTITIPELEQITGLSRSGVKKILRKLQEAGKVRRVGPDKGGHWEVL